MILSIGIVAAIIVFADCRHSYKTNRIKRTDGNYAIDGNNLVKFSNDSNFDNGDRIMALIFSSNQFGSLNPNIRFYNERQRKWCEVTYPFQPPLESAIAFLDKKIYIIGGTKPGLSQIEQCTNQVEIFDLVKNRYFEGPKLPAPYCFCRATVARNTIYVAASSTMSVNIRLFMLESVYALPKWKELSALNVHIYHFDLLAHKNFLFISGGIDDESNFVFSSKVVQYIDISNPDSTWQTAPELQVARGKHASAVVSNKLHICGGLTISGLKHFEKFLPLASCESLELLPGSGAPKPGALWIDAETIIDPNTKIEIPFCSINLLKYYNPSAGMREPSMIAIGGQPLCGSIKTSQNMYIFDVDADKWKVFDMPNSYGRSLSGTKPLMLDGYSWSSLPPKCLLPNNKPEKSSGDGGGMRKCGQEYLISTNMKPMSYEEYLAKYVFTTVTPPLLLPLKSCNTTTV